MAFSFLLSDDFLGIPQKIPSIQGMGYFLWKYSGSFLSRCESFQKEYPHEKIGAIVSKLSDSIDEKTLLKLKELFPHLELIANCAVGYNNIDYIKARELHIHVTNTPGVLVDATANIAFALLLMASRHLYEGASMMVQKGSFPEWSPQFMLGIDLYGKTLGIVGLGAIGKNVAQKAKAFGMKVVALESLTSSKRIPMKEGEIPRLCEEDFWQECDVVSLHCPLTPESRNWLNRDRIFRMKKGSILINTARGDIVDEDALAKALQEGHLYAAGLDVFRNEPVLSAALRNSPRLVVLPHIGSATAETRIKMGQRVVQSLEEYALKKDLTFCVNKDIL